MGLDRLLERVLVELVDSGLELIERLVQRLEAVLERPLLPLREVALVGGEQLSDGGVVPLHGGDRHVQRQSDDVLGGFHLLAAVERGGDGGVAELRVQCAAAGGSSDGVGAGDFEGGAFAGAGGAVAPGFYSGGDSDHGGDQDGCGEEREEEFFSGGFVAGK